MRLKHLGVAALALLACSLSTAQTTPAQIPQRYKVANIAVAGEPALASASLALNNNGRVVAWTFPTSQSQRFFVFDEGVLSWTADVPRVRPPGLASLTDSGEMTVLTYRTSLAERKLLFFTNSGTSVPVEFSPTVDTWVMPTAHSENGKLLVYARPMSETAVWYYLWSAVDGFSPLYQRTFSAVILSTVSRNGLLADGFTNSPYGNYLYDLPTLTFYPSRLEGYATSQGVNNAGDVVGESSPGYLRRCLASNPSCENATVEGNFSRGIKDNGSVLQISNMTPRKAWLWTRQALHRLHDPQLPSAFLSGVAANNRDMAVFTVFDSTTTTYRPYVWTAADQQLVNLNTRLPPGVAESLSLTGTLSVNDKGQILATGAGGLYLLTPDGPEPAPPTVGDITGLEVVPINTPVTLSAAFVDVNTTDTHAARWTWGDGTASTGSMTESQGSGSTSATHAWSTAGIYTMSSTVTDVTQRSGTATRQIVVYDPNAGFVTGSGWFVSPPGAVLANTGMTGRADFDFVSKYKKGATVPSGDTSFVFETAELRFASTAYDWLVVGGTKAQYKGSGSLNGQPNYKFMLTAIDGGNKGVDRFRIRIWHYDEQAQADVVDYDNQVDSSLAGTAQEGTNVRAGNIVVH